MIKLFWYLGTKKQCKKKVHIKFERWPKPVDPDHPKVDVCFNDVIDVHGHYFVPLDSFCEKAGITEADLSSDRFLEEMERIHQETGIFPIKKLDLGDDDI